MSGTTEKTQDSAAARGAVGSLPAPDETLLSVLEATGVALGLRATDRLAAAHDASHYLLTPQVVVRPRDVTQVGRVLAACRDARVPVTFRSGGTSLSGQSVTDAVLVDTRRGFRSVEVLDDGARVRAGPGSTVRSVNARLMPYGTKLGPDPASEIACTIGGVVANNSSGMACGIEANTYRTLDSAVLVLPSGTVVDTGAEDADARLQAGEPRIHAGLQQLRERIRSDPESVERLRRLHSLKNTMGYGLNSFLDHDRPADILEHLVIGSEGTLAFLSEATFRTVPVRPYASTGLLVFASLADAARAIPALVEVGFATVELMDAASLRVAQQAPQVPADLADLDVVGHAALLVELQEPDAAALAERIAAADQALAGLPLATIDAVSPDAPGSLLSQDSARRTALWNIRKGLFTAVAGSRPSGTTALLEDIAVPVERLHHTCEELIALFEAHGYQDAVIFGHAKDGNIHFMITDRFDDDGGTLPRYEAFTEDMVDLVLRHGGTLKAEHGTGRIMAPFVRRQVGDELYAVMQEVRALIDPDALLNPGVLLSEDPQAHLRDLKTSPTVEEEVDRCVECGYCEPVCPSRDLTTTPRERIVLRREIARAERRGDEELAERLRVEHRHDVVDTCAADGMCQTACPVLINIGDLVRRLRAEAVGPAEQAVGRAAVTAWAGAARGAGLALSAAHRLPAPLTAAATDLGRALLGRDRVPRWTPDLPAGGTPRPRLRDPAAQAVFFAACTGTMFGPAQGCRPSGGDGQDGVAAALIRLS
ncbi:FAD-binding and (Fe-S)-binding domain-containing protein, partial [Nesterenkonia xinjiangensis]